MESNSAEDVRVELAVRTLSPDGGAARQAEVIDRLRTLADEGAIDELTVDVWGKRVGLTNADAETDHGREVIETVEQFREWADDHGLSVGSFFETRRVENRITGESYTALDLPSMALAEYHGEDLHWVCPCLDVESDVTHGVRERVATLEREASEVTTRPGSRPAARPVAEE